jgi:signal peptidase
MEIITAPRPPAPSGWSRVVVALGMFAPVTLLALVPIGLGLQRYVVTSDAMSPSIGRGAVVFEKSVPVSDLRPGDVITFPRPAATAANDEPGRVTRRIVSIEDGWARTRADSEAAPDAWSLALDRPTVHRVVVALPYVGYVYLALFETGPVTALIAVGIGVIALVVALLLGRAHRLRRP